MPSSSMQHPVPKHLSPAVLCIKKSTVPGAGKGLFTREPVTKGQLIVEYKGRVTTWKAVTEASSFNAYVYYVNRNHVIDAREDLKALGRYANDAMGLVRLPGVVNNAQYITRGKQVFIQAVTDICAGAEILVAYGKEYWDVIRYNQSLEKKSPKKKK